MGLTDQFMQMAGSLLGGDQKQQSPILSAVFQMLGSKGGQGGGLTGLLQIFQDKGLGEVVSSWVSAGPNKPISAEQIQQGLGDDTVQRLAKQAGMSASDACSQLSNLLPNMVDKLTPDGEIPGSGSLEEVLMVLKQKLGQ